MNSDPQLGRLMALLAATAELPEAMAYYGDLLRLGRGAIEDPTAAADWYIEAWRAGEPRGALGLGYLVESGRGLPKDGRKAANFYRQAAEQGVVEARLALARMLRSGEGAPRHLEHARDQLLIAFGQGSAAAALMLGEMSRDAGDAEAATRWFETAAEAGEREAQLALAQAYRDGAGVPRDLVRAYAWANVAAAEGCDKSRSLRDSLSKTLGRDSIADAEALSERIWRTGLTPRLGITPAPAEALARARLSKRSS